jgi:hypothetical protein
MRWARIIHALSILHPSMNIKKKKFDDWFSRKK